MKQKEKQKKSPIKTFLKIALMLLIFGGLISAVLGLGDINDLTERLQNLDVKYLIVAILLTILYFVFMILPHFFIAVFQKTKVDKTRIFLNASNEYLFNAITPSQSGSQPVQSYIYLKHGATGDEASSILTAAYINYQMVANILSSIALIILVTIPAYAEVLKGKIAIVIIGFVLNFGVLLLIIFLTYSKKFPSQVQRFLYRLAKIKPFKEKLTKVADNTPQTVRKFQTSTTHLFKKKRFLIFTTLLRVIALVLYYLIPYFVAKSLGVALTPADMVFVMAISLVSTTLMAWFPLPGASGGVEAVFVLMLTSIAIINRSTAISVMFIWRLLTFYFGIIWGGTAFGLTHLLDYIKSKRVRVYQNKSETLTEKTLNVGLLCDSFHDNLEAKFLYNELISQGLKPYVLTHTKHLDNPLETIYLTNGKTKLAKHFNIIDKLSLKKNYRIIKSHNFDAIHSINTLFYLRLLLYIKKMDPTPIFVTNVKPDKSKEKVGKIKKIITTNHFEKLLNSADRVLPFTIEDCLYYHYQNFKPSYVMSPAILDSENIFKFKSTSKANTYSQFENTFLLFFPNFGLERFVDFYFGIKNFEEILKTTQFIIIGDFKLTNSLQNSIKKNNFENNFIFKTNLEEVLKVVPYITGYIKEEYSANNSIFYLIPLINNKVVLLPEKIQLQQSIQSFNNIYLYSYFHEFEEQFNKAVSTKFDSDITIEKYYNKNIGQRLVELYLEVAKSI